MSRGLIPTARRSIQPWLLLVWAVFRPQVVTASAFSLISWAMWLLLSMPVGLITIAVCLLVLDWKIELNRKEAS